MVLLNEYEVLQRVRQMNARAARAGEMERLLADARPEGGAWTHRLSRGIRRVRVGAGKLGRGMYELAMDTVCCVIAPDAGCC